MQRSNSFYFAREDGVLAGKRLIFLDSIEKYFGNIAKFFRCIYKYLFDPQNVLTRLCMCLMVHHL